MYEAGVHPLSAINHASECVQIIEDLVPVVDGRSTENGS